MKTEFRIGAFLLLGGACAMIIGCDSSSKSTSGDSTPMQLSSDRSKDYGPSGYNRDKAFFPATTRIELAEHGRRAVILYCTPEELNMAIGKKMSARDLASEVTVVTMFSKDKPVNGRISGHTVSQPYQGRDRNEINVVEAGYYSFQLTRFGKELTEWTPAIEVK